MKKTTLNPWAITTLVCLVFVVCNGFDSIGPNVPSLFSRIISTNKTADAWRSALGAGGSSDLTAVSNAQVTTAANLLSVSNAQITTAANLLSVSNAQITTAANLLSVSNAQITTAANLLSVSNAQITTAANLLSVSNAQVTTDGKLVGYITNVGGFATNAALTGGTMTSVTNLDLTASRVMVSDANKVPTSSSVTATTLGYLDATSSVQTQLDSKPTVALTNVARLDQSQTWTGTPTFPSSHYLSNRITYRTLFTTNSIFVASITNSTSSPTNDADYRNITAFLNLTLPPLCGTNSEVLFAIKFWPTNSEPNATGFALYLGDATNFVYAANNFASAPTAIATTGGGTAIFKNSRSMTNQVRLTAGAGSPGLATWNTFTTSPGYNLADTSANWSLRVGLFSANSANATTNLWFEEVTIVEKVTN